MGNGRGENGDWEGMKWGLGGEEMGTEREGNGDWERRKWGLGEEEMGMVLEMVLE